MSSHSSGRSTTIKIRLLDGTAEGLRLIEKPGWSGLAMMCSRAKYPQVRDRWEFKLPGVYFLTGTSGSQGGRSTLYIGQADSARKRLDNHDQRKEFWTHLAVFTATGGHVNRAHIQYLESRLIDLAQAAKRTNVLNGNAPGLPTVSESDRDDSESFLEQILLLCSVLGLDYFQPLIELTSPHRLQPPKSPRPVVDATDSSKIKDVSTNLFLTGPGTLAIGRSFGKALEVFADGVARADCTPSVPDWAVRLRQELLSSGTLVKSAKGLTLTKNHLFKSPTAAAAAMLGASADGRIKWKDAQGRTLKQLQEMALEDPVDVN